MWVSDFISKNGYSPTYAEIGASVGVGKNTLVYHLSRLSAAKLVKSIPFKQRTLRLTEAGEAQARKMAEAMERFEPASESV